MRCTTVVVIVTNCCYKLIVTYNCEEKQIVNQGIKYVTTLLMMALLTIRTHGYAVVDSNNISTCATEPSQNGGITNLQLLFIRCRLLKLLKTATLG